MAKNQLPIRNASLLRVLKGRKAEFTERFDEQRKALLKLKAMAKLGNDLGVDMDDLHKFATTGIDTVEALKKQIDAIIELKE